MGCVTSKSAVVVSHRQLQKSPAPEKPSEKPWIDKKQYAPLDEGDGPAHLPPTSEEQDSEAEEAVEELEEAQPKRKLSFGASLISLRKLDTPVEKSVVTLRRKSTASLELAVEGAEESPDRVETPGTPLPERCATAQSLHQQIELRKEQFLDAQKYLEVSYTEAASLRPQNIDEMWAIVKKTSDKDAISVEPTKNRKGWRTIRIFVSSTFRDFHHEREVLVKEVSISSCFNFKFDFRIRILVLRENIQKILHSNFYSGAFGTK